MDIASSSSARSSADEAALLVSAQPMRPLSPGFLAARELSQGTSPRIRSSFTLSSLKRYAPIGLDVNAEIGQRLPKLDQVPGQQHPSSSFRSKAGNGKGMLWAVKGAWRRRLCFAQRLPRRRLLSTWGPSGEGAAMLPAYTTLHFAAKWQISWVLSLDARLLNVANRHYEPAAGYQSMGHQAWLGLRREVAGQLPRVESFTRARARRRRACTSGMSLPRDFSFLYGGAQSVPAAAPREVDHPARSKTMPHPVISQSPNPNTSDSRRTAKGEPHGRWKLLRPIL